jgi:hypothetical protein
LACASPKLGTAKAATQSTAAQAAVFPVPLAALLQKAVRVALVSPQRQLPERQAPLAAVVAGLLQTMVGAVQAVAAKHESDLGN